MSNSPFDDPDLQIEVVAVLSEKGQLDALKKGKTPSSGVSHQVTRVDPVWDRVVDLGPAFSPRGGCLVINRARHVWVENTEAAYLEETYVWRRPRAVVEYGTVRPLDSFMTLDELIELEEANARESAALIEELGFQGTLAKWEAWFRTFLAESVANLPDPEDFFACSEFAAGRRFRQLARGFDHNRATDDEIEELFRSHAAAVKEAKEASRSSKAYEVKQAALKEAAAWAGEHGSTRLQKAVRANLIDAALGVYRDERLALERPNYRYMTKRDQEKLNDVVNPKEVALDALLEAREWDEHASLRYFYDQDRDDATQVVVASFLNRLVIRFPEKEYRYDEEPF